jgi:hypothetical protein
MKEKQISVISEKLNFHLVLFSSVEKEVAALKRALGDVQCLVGEKENVGMNRSQVKCTHFDIDITLHFILILSPTLFFIELLFQWPT